MTASLYDRLGGADRIATLCHGIVERHFTNPLIKTRFEQIKDRPKFEKHVFDFFSAGTGGPQNYQGKEVLEAHRHMNINEQELIAAIDDIMNEMTECGYEQAEKSDVLAILYSLKGHVVHV